jgi:hypothetical protein
MRSSPVGSGDVPRTRTTALVPTGGNKSSLAWEQTCRARASHAKRGEGRVSKGDTRTRTTAQEVQPTRDVQIRHSLRCRDGPPGRRGTSKWTKAGLRGALMAKRKLYRPRFASCITTNRCWRSLLTQYFVLGPSKPSGYRAETTSTRAEEADSHRPRDFARASHPLAKSYPGNLLSGV